MTSLFLSILIVPFLGLSLVNGGFLPEGNCPPFCKDKFLDKVKADLCVGKCSPGYGAFDSCMKVCLDKNPEASALCSFNCKLDGTHPEDKQKSDGDLPTTSDLSPGVALDLASTMAKVHSYMNNLMDRVSTKTGNFEDWVSDSYNNWFKNAGEEGVKDDKTGQSGQEEGKESKQDDANVEIKVWKLGGDGVDQKAAEMTKDVEAVDKEVSGVQKKEEEEKAEDGTVSLFEQPTFHRFIIIRRIPLFSIFKQPSRQEAPLIPGQAVTGGSEDREHKYFSFFGRQRLEGSRCPWRRPLLFVLFALLCICLTWYCMARLLACRSRLIQESMIKAEGHDFEYLIPIDEKMVFLKSDAKLSIMDEDTPPPPYKFPSKENLTV